jgi:hypothetical protein
MEWKISRGQGKCLSCDKNFAEDEPYYATLMEENDEFVRKDYCPACWQAMPKEVFSFWMTRLPRKGADARPVVDNEVLLDFFVRLENQESPAKLNLRYLLALLLMRKKILKFEDILREDDREYLVLRQTGENLRHRVLDPKLSLQELNRLRDDLSQVLYLEA